MNRKIKAIIIGIAIIGIIVIALGIVANAETYSETIYYSMDIYYDLRYTISNSKATVTDIVYSYETEPKLRNVCIPATLGGYPVTEIGDNVFNGYYFLTQIELPDSITAIGANAFYKCQGITNIILPNSLSIIGDSAFYGCSNLTSITIPDSVTRLSGCVFDNCSNLINIFVDGDNEVYSAINGVLFTKDKTELVRVPSAKYGKYIIPQGVTIIDDSAFYGCSRLTEITISGSVTSIGSSSFRGCASLTNMVIPQGVTIIGDSAFYGCSSLTRITIPDSVISIGNSAFRGCTSLSDIIIPDGVASIGGSTFRECSSLTNTIIPDSVTSIEDGAFYGCRSLTNITIPNGVNSIGASAFRECSSLTNIIIPNGVVQIGDSTFRACSRLTDITIPNSVTIINYGAFSDCIRLNTIHFNGNESIWDKIEIGNNNYYLLNAKKRFFFYVTVTGENGEIVINDKFDENAVLTVPAKTGYVAKLYTDAECTDEFDIAIPITSNLALNLRYESIETKTTISNDGKVFTVLPYNIGNGNAVILALYNCEVLSEAQIASCKNEEIIFTTNKAYTNAKVFVWESLISLKPICGVEVVK